MVPEINRQADVALRVEAALGEGALWDWATERLLWVDIAGQRVELFDPTTGQNRSLQLDSMVGTVVPTARGDLLVAIQEGVARLDRITGRLSDLRCPATHDPRRIRFNDGKCDPAGRFWAGTMALDFAPGAGALYCFQEGKAMRRRLEKVTISNGIAWSLDHRRMYYIDTPTGRVDVFDYDDETGAIRGRRGAIEIPAAMGRPDGMTIDAGGKLWIALWGGAAVSCWDPVTGKLLRTVVVPASQVTSCAFGGPSLQTLFITTAREGLSDAQLAREPLAGSIFAIELEVPGTRAFAYLG